MSETKLVYSNDIGQSCPGDLSPEECPLIQLITKEKAQSVGGGLMTDKSSIWVRWPDFSGGCVTCRHNYIMEAEKVGEVTTRVARFNFDEPETP